MIVSFFSHTEYSTGVDYSQNPDCIFQQDIDFDPIKEMVVLSQNGESFLLEIIPLPETEEQKRVRKLQEFVSAEVIENFDWEGIELSGDDFNRLIILRNFESDQGAQVASLAKKDIKDLAFFITVLGVDKAIINQFYADEIAKARALSDTRVALGLTALPLSFLD